MLKIGKLIILMTSAAILLIGFAGVSIIPAFASAADVQKNVLIISPGDLEQTDITATLYRDVVDRISKHIRKAGFQTTMRSSSMGADDVPPMEQEDAQLLLDLREDNTQKLHAEKIDYVAIVQILADMVLLDTGTQINVVIQGRMLRVDNHDVLARFSLPVPNYFIAPPSCDRNCVLELLLSNTGIIADGLGHVLGQRLKNGSN